MASAYANNVFINCPFDQVLARTRDGQELQAYCSRKVWASWHPAQSHYAKYITEWQEVK